MQNAAWGKCLREFAAALRLSREKGVGAATFRRLIDEHGLPCAALRFWRRNSIKASELAAVSLNKSPTAQRIRDTLKMMRSGQLLGWYYSQPGYPEQLKDLGEPPPVFFASAPLRPVKYAAVVGARHLALETPMLVAAASKILMDQGYALVSGGAAGVDSLAHQAALDAGFYTLAVLGTGLDIVYPAGNLQLFKRIREAGALMTELMPGARPARSFFPTRNRIIAAMAETVVVIQASLQSGSMITAGWARRLNRRLLVVQPPTGSTDAELWAGNRQLLESGAEAMFLK